LTHYFFVFPWLGMVAYLLISRGKFTRLNLAVCLLLTGALILPWYINLPFGVASWRVTLDWLEWGPPRFDRTSALRDTLLRFFAGSSGLWRTDRLEAANPAALTLFGVIALAAAWRLRVQVFTRGRLLLWLVFASACLGPLALDLVGHMYAMLYPRYTITALPSAYLLAGLALAALDRRIMLIGVTLIILTWVPDILGIDRSRVPSLPLREVARAVAVDISPSDLILVRSTSSRVLGIARYAT
jgi:hypothetical protein